MSLDRRQFLGGAVAGAALLACGKRGEPTTAVVDPQPDPAPAPPAKRSILVLGGTGFLGPHVVEAARARGHTLTLFNRGKTNPGLFPDVETLHGDRDGDLKALEGRTWDAVVDTSGYVPRIVRASAELLAPSVGHYVFISTISVYKSSDKVGADEDAALETVADPASEDVSQFYGGLKALSEQAAEAAMPGKVANIRPGLIVGPLDPTGRFTHWPTRLAEGGEALAPGDGKTFTQWIDGRDLAAFVVKTIEDRTVGVYNALGPERRVTMKELLDTCNAAGGNRATLTWVDAAFLEAQQVAPWSELPLWIPPEGDYAGFGTMSNARAIAQGLTFRPLRETAADTLAWVKTLPADAPPKLKGSGLSRERERAVLAAYASRKASPQK